MAKLNRTYDADSKNDRRDLAVAIHRALAGRGFEPNIADKARGGEVVYTRPVADGIEVKVYSSIDWNTGVTRGVGADAIRVCAVYNTRDGKTRGIAKDRRVNRVGKIEDIVGRMMQRGADVWEKASNPHCCYSCGAPTFISKKGNAVCAELCWTK